MELRKDYILNRYVILAAARKFRPREFVKEETKEAEQCFFCAGNENLTPPEIGRISEGKRWVMRWFPNKFPAVEPKGNAEIRTDNTFYTFSDAYGYHEIIVETPEHSKQLWDLEEETIEKLFRVYNERINALAIKDKIRHVVVFKNHGKDAGTSLVHSHTQIAAINLVPPYIQEKAEATKRHGSCPYCSIIAGEKNSYRRCFENDTMVAFAPYASRFNYEIWIFPKRHIVSLADFTDGEFKDISGIAKQILSKLKELNVSYNYCLQYSPAGESLHFHIEVLPRAATWAGFEFSSNIIINSVSPEDAAKFYRGEA
ncbi:MAG TPA: DUF4931 domain-containing protein [Candidatus Nanoarchaeia archaeon]|nr:DUF4931 domain-containing protein [Candidatus Nanoarchaeia archaeon]